MSSVDVIIPVFATTVDSSGWWHGMADRAQASVTKQTRTADCVIRSFSKLSVADARNGGAELSDAEWLIFLDADDELDPHYIEAMLAGSGDMRWPATLGFYEDGHEDDQIGHLAPNGASLLHHNWMVIGTMIRRDLFLTVGGFRDLPILEDWDLWIRMVLSGAKPESCYDAVYRINVRPNSRNAPENHAATYTEIQRLYSPEWYAKGLS